MKSIDPLLTKQYNQENYHCVHFLIDAAKYLLDADYTDNFIGLTSSLHETLKTSRSTVVKNRVISRDQIKDGTIVLMKNENQSSHVGLFFCNRVLHLTELGVHFMPLISIQQFYKRIRFYEPYQSFTQSS